MTKPVVLIAEELSPATLDALGPDFEVRHVDGADRSALLPALADVDAVLIRSATKMDAEALAAAKNLKVVARAGVGLDNVDVPAVVLGAALWSLVYTTVGFAVVDAWLGHVSWWWALVAAGVVTAIVLVSRRLERPDPVP